MPVLWRCPPGASFRLASVNAPFCPALTRLDLARDLLQYLLYFVLSFDVPVLRVPAISRSSRGDFGILTIELVSPGAGVGSAVPFRRPRALAMFALAWGGEFYASMYIDAFMMTYVIRPAELE